MKPHLFLFTIGPVQSFIEQSRKTHDLYAGSRILADLTLVAALEAQNQGIELIFPYRVEKGSPLPNRFIGKISNQSNEELQKKGDKIAQAVNDSFDALAQKVLNTISKTANNIFNEQIKRQWDINWLFYPIEGESDQAYRHAYQHIEQEMNAVKNMRILTQNPETGRKCSLDGEREALFFGPDTNPNYYKHPDQIIQKGLWLASNEGLSAVSLVKRGYEKEIGKPSSSFPSTAEIALLDQIRQKTGLFNLYKAFINTDEFDYQFCYKENITEKYLKKNGYGDILKRISPLSLEKCRQETFGSAELPKHYGLIAFDGDQMGQIISGISSNFIGSDLQDFQRSVSSRLMIFAETIQQKFKDNPHWGRVVYTGGDDFLGFVNLEYLFVAVRHLRQDFQNIVNKPLREDGYFAAGYNFTFSAGIVMAHYKTPLSIVIRKAKELEHTAKNSGRNAFAIAALKHSGESHEACFGWELDRELWHWNALEQLTGFLEQQVCSENFARVLTHSFYLLQNSLGEIPNSNLVKTELKRTVQRSMSPDHKSKSEQVITCVEQLLLSPNEPTGATVSLKNFTEALNIALFLKRVRKNKSKNNGNQNPTT